VGKLLRASVRGTSTRRRRPSDLRREYEARRRQHRRGSNVDQGDDDYEPGDVNTVAGGGSQDDDYDDADADSDADADADEAGAIGSRRDADDGPHLPGPITCRRT